MNTIDIYQKESISKLLRTFSHFEKRWGLCACACACLLYASVCVVCVKRETARQKERFKRKQSDEFFSTGINRVS